MIEICHITTVHSRYDVRIFHKECTSLSPFYAVNLIVADGLGDETKNGIKIYDIGLRQTNRVKRAGIDSKKALKKAIELNCQLYHFHDPELIKMGLKLKKSGKKVIYDTHEDLPRQIYGKPYLKKWTMPIVSFLIEWQENKGAKKFDYIFSATSFIRDRFLKINKNTIDINNYPIIDELSQLPDIHTERKYFCYTGGITRERGILNLVSAFREVKTKLLMAGPMDGKGHLEELKEDKGWKNVEFMGLVDRKKLPEIFSKSIAGFVTFLPLPNHINAQPNKIFEYMSAGIPVIGSDFKLWKAIIEDNHCGICVNPLDSKDIAKAANHFMANPVEAEEMGKNGQKAVKEKYNWSIEEKKLLKVYKEILGE